MILKLSANPSALLVGLDRQEIGISEISSSKELEKDFHIRVESIVNLDTLVDFVKDDQKFEAH